jgi:hypothetical protein
VSIHFINLGEVDQRASNQGVIIWKMFVRRSYSIGRESALESECSSGQELSYEAWGAFYRWMERGSILCSGPLTGSGGRWGA